MSEQLEMDFASDLDLERNPDNINNRILGLLEHFVDNQSLFNGRLWSMDDIALYAGVSIRTARRIMTCPGAPRSIEMPTGPNTNLPSRYASNEVVEYFIAQRR